MTFGALWPRASASRARWVRLASKTALAQTISMLIARSLAGQAGSQR
jgi:hypothetical protein